jgi:protein tyrosine kinase modulator
LRQLRNAPVLATNPPPPPVQPALIPSQYAHGALSLAQVLAIAKAHRRKSILLFIAILAAAIVVVKFLPKSYTAEATVLVNFETNEGTRQAPPELFASYLLTQVDLLQSREVLMKVIDRLGLTNDAEFTEGYRPGSNGTIRDWVDKQLRANLSAEQGKGTQLLIVSVTSRDPNKAAKIANAIVEAYQTQQPNHGNDPGSDRAQEYSQQLTDLKEKVATAEKNMAEFRQRTGITDINSQTDVETQTLAALQTQLLAAEGARRAAEAKSVADQGTSDQVMASQLVQNLKNQISTLQAQLAELTATLGPRHPRVLELESQIAASRRSLEHEIQTFSQNSSSNVTGAAQIEVKLRRAVEDERTKLVGIRQLQDQGQKLQLELESAQTVYKRALDSYDQFLFASTSLVSRAVPPLQASKPNKVLLSVIAAFVSLLFGVGGPIVHELLFNRRLHSRDDFERDLGLPVLAELDRLPAEAVFT